MKRLGSVAAMVLLVLVSRAWAHDGHDDGPAEQAFKVGKNGEVKFGEDVKMGSLLVKKGRYVLEHRVEGNRHFIVLTSAERSEQAPAVYDVPMTVVASKVAAKKSAVFAAEGKDRSLRVTVVQIGGEKFDHLPGSSTEAATQ
jgi:hypothetical protein